MPCDYWNESQTTQQACQVDQGFLQKDTIGHSYTCKTFINTPLITLNGVTLAQLVMASASQADVQRFEPHLNIIG